MNTISSAEHDALLSQLAEDLELQSADFLWLEFYTASNAYGPVRPGSKLARLLERAHQELPGEGFRWMDPPAYFRAAIESTRRQIMHADSEKGRRAVAHALLADDNPAFLQHLAVQ
jgi:hypothetical protein